jgi:spore coat polysaccharide biosynthesis predicted glycosyltransferase SpsG
VKRVHFRAEGGPRVGAGHEMRTRALAEELRQRGGEPSFVVDDEAAVARLSAAGYEARSVHAAPHWASEPAAGAWLDGFRSDWCDDLRRLARRGTPSFLVENRTRAREWASWVVHPSLHFAPDPWERVHAARVLGGAPWIPLARALRATPPAPERDLALLVTFGASDPRRSTERVLAQLPRDTRVAVTVGVHMRARRADVERAAAHLAAELVASDEPLGPWMARARLAVTALGTTLYELAYLGTPALILANHAADRPVLAHYRAAGPFEPLGLAAELEDRALADALAQALTRARAPLAVPHGLGAGAANLAERLLAPSALALAA